MPEEGSKDLADKLQAASFTRVNPDVDALSDPIADTPMVVTLDQLQPYENNPRATRNPRFDDIKASILARGLDSPPPITRRPGEAHYIIRNGGNTRLAILHELWAETKQEQFFRIRCLFRPWTARGEIVVLTGHLAENELHGSLSFIERALGIERARELYECEDAGHPLTQTELARRLTQDGYPITQSHVSRMQEAVRHLLPAIPSVLYAGLGKPQIDRLTALRRATEKVYVQHLGDRADADAFSAQFHDVLSKFDSALADFDVQRVRDEMIGEFSTLLSVDYHELSLKLIDAESRQHALTRAPTLHVKQHSPADSSTATVSPAHAESTPRSHAQLSPTTARDAIRPSSDDSTRLVVTASPSSSISPTTSPSRTDGSARAASPGRSERAASDAASERLQAHIVSPASTTDRLQAIQRLVADASGAPVSDFATNVVHAVPVQAGGLHPISDVWYIDPQLDVSDRLRAHVGQLAREIAQEAGIEGYVESAEDGIGYRCALPHEPGAVILSLFARATLTLLSALSSRYLRAGTRSGPEDVRLGEYVAALLQGVPRDGTSRLAEIRLSDASLVKLFRLIRLARRFLELQSTDATQAPAPRM